MTRSKVGFGFCEELIDVTSTFFWLVQMNEVIPFHFHKMEHGAILAINIHDCFTGFLRLKPRTVAGLDDHRRRDKLAQDRVALLVAEA